MVDVPPALAADEPSELALFSEASVVAVEVLVAADAWFSDSASWAKAGAAIPSESTMAETPANIVHFIDFSLVAIWKAVARTTILFSRPRALPTPPMNSHFASAARQLRRHAEAFFPEQRKAQLQPTCQ
jgi:hypothetical protein